MTDLESDVFRRDYDSGRTRPTAVDSTEKKEAAGTGPNPESGDEAVGRRELLEILNLLGRSLRETLPADDGWLLVYEARDRLKIYLDGLIQ